MKDFDTERALRVERDRTFKLGGRTFTRKAGVKPEALTEYEDMPDDVSAQDAVAIMDRTLLAFLIPEDHASFNEMRSEEAENEVTVDDLADLVRWLIAENTGRPTSKPSPSSDGAGQTKAPTPSTAPSPSPEPVPAG